MSTFEDREIGPPGITTSDRRKLRSACDMCHQTKIRCSGGLPCVKCAKLGTICGYSPSNRVGRPKTSRNKKTLKSGTQSQQDNNAQSSDGSHDWVPDSHGIQSQSPICLRQDLMLAHGDMSSQRADLDLLRSFGHKETETSSQHDPLSSSSQLISPLQDSSWLSNFDFIPSPAECDSHPPITDQSPTPISLTAPSYMSREGTSMWQLPSTNTSITSFSPSSDSGICKCLQTQAALLVGLKELSKRQRRGLGCDAILLEISRALDAWQTFLHCDACNFSSHVEESTPDDDVAEDAFETLSLATLNARLAVCVLQTQLRQFWQSSSDGRPQRSFADDEQLQCNHPAEDCENALKGTTSLVLGAYRADPAEAHLISALLLFRATEKVATQLQALVRQADRQIQAADRKGVRVRGQDQDGNVSERRYMTGMKDTELEGARSRDANHEQIHQVQVALRHLQTELQDPKAGAQRIVCALMSFPNETS